MPSQHLPLPLPQLNEKMVINRLPHFIPAHYEIKDPSVVQVAPDHFMMFASIGNSVNQSWLVGRFEAESPLGPWQELEPVEFVGIEGPQLCAPAVMIEEENGKVVWNMYIQTACFEENGVIAYATSEDGQVFYGKPQPVISREHVDKPPYPVVGVYDVAVSDVKDNHEDLLCMLYSGYRRIGCGDIYLSTKRKTDEAWSAGECILAQEQVPFHNDPLYEYYEWGLEGAKLIQLKEDCFLLIGVCFNPKPQEFAGNRQRVFLAVASSIRGPFKLLGTPFMPFFNEGKSGENGHPDTLILDNELMVIYQERDGVDKPWYLRIASFSITELTRCLESILRGEIEPLSVILDQPDTLPVRYPQTELVVRPKIENP